MLEAKNLQITTDGGDIFIFSEQLQHLLVGIWATAAPVAPFLSRRGTSGHTGLQSKEQAKAIP